MTAWAVARLLAMSTYEVARDLASWSFTELRAGLSEGPVETKPLALAAYTLGWTRVYAAAIAVVATTISSTPSQCRRRIRQ